MKKELFNHGPLYQKRFEIMEKIGNLKLKSGDILYRYSDAKGPLNIPFTKLVSNITKSEYSHSAIIVVENDEVNVMEVNDQGTLKFRLLDWIDTCYDNNFSIYRLKNITDVQEQLLKNEINNMLKKDCDYDFTFSDNNKFYCTESVIYIYNKSLNIQLDEGYYLKELLNPFQYVILKIGSFLFSIFGTSLPFDKKLYFVGNEDKGMISSKYTELVAKIT